MPNQKGGKKFKRGKKNSPFEKKLIFKDPKENQEYAKIKKVNGSGRYQISCFDGADRLGIIAGNIKRKVRLAINDVVLVSLWEFQDNKCSIIHKYERDEVMKLKKENEFPDTIQLGEENDFIENEYNPFDIDSKLEDESDESEESEESEESGESKDEGEINLDDI